RTGPDPPPAAADAAPPSAPSPAAGSPRSPVRRRRTPSPRASPREGSPPRPGVRTHPSSLRPPIRLGHARRRRPASLSRPCPALGLRRGARRPGASHARRPGPPRHHHAPPRPVRGDDGQAPALLRRPVRQEDRECPPPLLRLCRGGFL